MELQKTSDGNVLETTLKRKIVLLEDTLARISAIRMQLKENSDFVKYEIRSSFCHQLEQLRLRETVLLAQLEAIANAKEEVLSLQQSQLHEALGAYRQGLECLSAAMEESKNSNSDGALEGVRKQIAEILNSMTAQELKPRESSVLKFDADSYKLRRALQSFGRISVTDSKLYESLPSSIEDYNDDDDKDHLQNKPFQRHTVRVCSGVPKLSDSQMDWLMKEALTGTAHMSTHVVDRGESLFEGGSKPPGLKKAKQLNNWLHQIKAQVESEPSVFENLEITSNRHDDNHEEIQKLFDDYFQQVQNSPIENWLIQGGNTVDYRIVPYPIFECFSRVTSMNEWLYDPSKQVNADAVTSVSPSYTCGSDISKCEDVQMSDVEETWVLANNQEVFESIESCLASLSCSDKTVTSNDRSQMDWILTGVNDGGSEKSFAKIREEIWSAPMENFLIRLSSAGDTSTPGEAKFHSDGSNDLEIWLTKPRPFESEWPKDLLSGWHEQLDSKSDSFWLATEDDIGDA